MAGSWETLHLLGCLLQGWEGLSGQGPPRAAGESGLPLPAAAGSCPGSRLTSAPAFPSPQTGAQLPMSRVGRLSSERLGVSGPGTLFSLQWERWLPEDRFRPTHKGLPWSQGRKPSLFLHFLFPGYFKPSEDATWGKDSRQRAESAGSSCWAQRAWPCSHAPCSPSRTRLLPCPLPPLPFWAED